MFNQIRQYQPVIMVMLLVGMLILAAWVTLAISTVEAQSTTSQLSNSRGPTPTPLALTCNQNSPSLINRSASSNQTTIQVGDFVWHDQNQNGLQDDGEPGVPNITCGVCKEGEGGAAIDLTTTDAEGGYQLSVDLAFAGTYYLICASMNDQYAFTLQNAGNNELDSDFEAVENLDYPFFGQSDSFLLIPGQENDHTQDAGLVFTATTATPTYTPSPVTPSPTPTSTQTEGTVTPSPTPTATSTSITADIEPNVGGTLTYTDEQDNETIIEVPGGAVTDTTRLSFTPNGAQTNPNFSFAGHAFSLDAYQNNQLQEGFTFNLPITMTINYSDEDITGITENSLLLYYWEEAIDEWIDAATTCDPDSSYQRDLANNSLSVAICHLTDFALFGPEIPKNKRLYLPVIQR